MNKLTKIVLSFLMVITCINFSTVQAEDGEEVNYSEPTTVETVSEDPANEVEQEVAQEEPAVEEEATVEEAPAEQPAEEAAPEEAASEEVTVAAEPQQEETTATPEEPQEEATEEVQYPAFNATIEEQGVTLSASEGVFPQGTTVSTTDKSDDDAVVNALEATISAANGENLQATGFVAYDFSFVDASGNKVEPKGDVSVTYSNISTTIPSSEVYRVYHVTDDGNVEAVEDSKVTVSDGQVTFTANSFSSYAVVGYNTIQNVVNAEGTENSDANTSEDNIALAASNYKTITKGKTETLTATKRQEVTWKITSGEDVVSISDSTKGGRWEKATAKIYANKIGNATVTNGTDTWNIEVVANSYTVRFDINGGDGTTPSNVTVEENKIITLPSGDAFSRSNYELVGWSENINAIKTYKIDGQYPIYPCGDKFEVTKNTKLYAVWARNSGEFRAKLAVAVRTDGRTPGEPSINYDDVYKYYVNNVTEDNILEYISPAKTVAGVAAVKTVLTDAFYQMITDLNAANKGDSTKPYYNPETQYIEWYVVKYQDNDDTFHVDGTIKDKNVVTLSYDKNGATSGIIPDSSTAYAENNEVIIVSKPGNFYDPHKSDSWQGLKRSGYEFSGWNTAADGTGTTYQPGNQITLSKNITLYAQWKAKEYTVKYDTKGGDTINDATVNYNDVVALPTLTREDSNFLGWTYNGNPVEANSTYASIAGSENTTEIVLVAQWENTAGGQAGYFLSKPGAGWDRNVDEVFDHPWTDSANRDLKYRIKQLFHYGDTFTVTDAVPVVANASFIGWLDKERSNNEAAIKHAGDTVTYSYNKSNGKYSTYCLDALWAELKIEGVNEKYNGQPKTTSNAIIDINKGSKLDDEYKQQADRLITKGEVYYSIDQNNWSTEKPSFTDAGTYTVYAKQDVTVGERKTTLKASAQVVINPRTVTLTSADDSKPYDGTALTNDTVTVGGDEFVTGEGASYDVKGTITNAGEADNTFTYTLNSNTKAGNYTIKKTEGKLKVTPVTSKVTVTVTGNTGSVTYDGSKHEVTGYNTSFSNVLYTATDFSFSGKAEASRTDAGKTSMGLSAEQFKNVSKNFTNVEFAVTDGYSEVTKRNVTLTSASDEKVYNGKPLTNGKVTVSGDGFATGEGATYDVTGSQTVAGSSENTFTYTLKQGTKADNYTVTTVKGTLTVTNRDAKYEITVKANSTNATYDGQSHTAKGVETTTFEVDGNTYTVSGLKTENPVKTDAGRYTNNITGTAVVKDASGNDVTSQFTVKTENGNLVISKRNVTLTSASDSRVYNGKPLRNDKVTVSGDGFATGEGATYDVTGSQTVAGSSENTFTYTLNEGTNPDNYTITKAKGTLTVNPYDEAIIAKVFGTRATYVYDGKQYSVAGFTVKFEKPDGTPTLYGNKVVLKTGKKAIASGTDVGDYTMNLKDSDFEWNDANFSNVTITIAEDGLLKITPASIDPTDPDNSTENTRFKVTGLTDVLYNGAEQKQTPTIKDTTTNKDLVEGTDYTITCNTEDFTNAGTITYTIKGKGNYSGTREVSYNINKRTVNLKSDTASKIYDGTALTRPDVTVTGDGFVEGEVTDLRASGSVTTVEEGEVDNAIEYTEGDSFKAENYNISYDVGTLMIVASDEEAIVVIKGHKATFEYDGTDKAVYGYDVSITEGSKYTANDFMLTTAAEAKGTEAGTYAMGLNAEDFVNLSDNFTKVTFKVEDGSLTITSKTIVPDGPKTPEEKKTGIEVTEPDDSKYTGEEHKNTPTVTDTKTGKTLVEGTDYTLTYSADVTNAGTVTVTVTGIGNYTGEFNVTYEITKRNVVLTSATDSKKFDGTPLRNENVEVTGEGFAEGEGATYSEFAEVTNVTDEAVANTFTYSLNENTLASNYNISTELGILTITPKTIIPDQPGTPEEEKTGITVENPDDVKYDGKDHAEKPVIKDEKTGVTLEEGKDYEIVYPEDIKNAGEITATVVGKGDYEGSFEIKYNITKRDVTFTSATDSKQYDGNALTNGNVEITGDGFIEGEGATFNVTGSITDVGSTNNAFTYAMNEGTNADNYNVTVVEGTLTVSEQPVVPTPATPTTPSNNTPARTNNVPARAVTQPTTTTPAPEATVEPEKAETTPAPTAKPEKIEEEVTPQAAPKGHWALINLIAAMLSVVLAVVALLAKHAKDEDEDDEDKDDQVVANENEDDENESTRHRRWKVIATIDAILAVVVFILTENISLPMVLVDKWTLLMVLFGLISIVSTYFARKWHEEDEDEDEESSQNA